MMKKFVCVVNARLKSERVPRKMLAPFAGSCLLEIALKKLLACDFLDQNQLYLGAYDEKIKDIGRKLGVQIYNRTYESTLEPVTMDVIYKYLWDIDTEYVLEINPCNPLLNSETINRALHVFFEKEYKSLFSVVKRQNFYFNQDSSLMNRFIGNEKYLPTLETKLIEPVYEAAHCIYIWKAERVKKEGLRWNLTKNDPFLFEIPPDEAFDIDWPWQFNLAENFYIQNFGIKKN
jgi:CMP-N-acetylneuraminic acid synthetase